MKPLGKRRIFGTRLDKIPAVVIESLPSSEPSRSRVLKTVGWVSAGLGAVALGLFVGRELRQRYKFNRRTPYEIYSHAGDEMQDVEFGVGI